MGWLRREKGKGRKASDPPSCVMRSLIFRSFATFFEYLSPGTQNVLIQLVQLPSNAHLLPLLTLCLRQHGLPRATDLRWHTV